MSIVKRRISCKSISFFVLIFLLYLCNTEAFADSAIYNYTDGTTVNAPGPVRIVSDDSYALDARDGGAVHSSFDVFVSGDNSYGLYAENEGTVVVSGNINMEGANVAGAQADMTGRINIDGNIVISGDSSYATGIYANYDSTVTLTGGISIEGEGSVGVSAYEGSDVSVDKGVFVSGPDSAGIYADYGSVVNIGESVTVWGKGSTGAQSQYSGEVKIGGDVTVSGDTVLGLWAHERGTLQVVGSVYVSGDRSHGAIASEEGSVINIGGGIYLSGDESMGAQAWSRGEINISGDVVVSGDNNNKGAKAWTYSEINIDGRLFVSGDSSVGANADEGSRITIGDGVAVFGEGVYGVNAGNFSQIEINGGVFVSGDCSTAVHSWHYETEVTVVGDVTAQGAETIAVHAWDNALIDITGNVYAKGENATGAYAWEFGTINVAGNVAVEGENAFGAHAWRDASTINIDGSVSVSGDNATAAFAEETSVINIKNGVVTSKGADNATLLVQYGGLISLDNAAAVTEGGTLVKTEDFGSIYAENGSAMFGDVVNLNEDYEDEMLNLTLSGASSLSGSINDRGAEAATNVVLSDTLSAWYVTDNSIIKGTLENYGTVDFRSAQQLITVTAENLGSDIATGGTFAMKAEVARETADLLKVTGTSSGSYLIKVDNDGREATNGTEVTLLVETADRNSDFALTHLVERGAWLYGLRQNTTNTSYGSGAGWELYAKDISDPGSAAINTYRASYMLNYAETTLIQRMGDLRASPNLRGVWARFYGGEFEAKDHGTGGAKAFEMSYGGVHIGYDRKLAIGWDGDFYFGVTAGYSAGDLDLHSGGDSDVKSYMVGMYGTFIHPGGFYLDAVLKYRWKESDFGTYDSVGDYVSSNSISTGGFGWSIEFGQRISWSGKPKDGWYAEPQVQLRYQRQGAGYYDLSNGLRIGADGVTSVIGRLGILVGHEKGDRNYYAKVFRLREFDGKLNVWTGEHTYLTTESLGGSWWVYGLGLTARVNDRNFLYCDIERTAGSSDFQQKWRLNAGWRHEL